MKRLIIAAICVLLFAIPCQARHLSCDPQSASAVTKYQITIDGEVFPAEIESVGTDQVRIYYNIDHLGSGKYTATAQAGNDGGEWSGHSNICEFYQGVPTPQNIGLYCVTEEPKRISQQDWTVHHVSSENIGSESLKAFDADLGTYWHSKYSPPPSAHPHELQINLGAFYSISGFYYSTRQDDTWNGTIKNYIFYVSSDGENWKEIKVGQLAQTKEEQSVSFDSVTARYVSIVALSEINDGVWAAMAEFNVLGVLTNP